MTTAAIQRVLVARIEISTAGGMTSSSEAFSVDEAIGREPSLGTTRTVAQMPMKHVPRGEVLRTAAAGVKSDRLATK